MAFLAHKNRGRKPRHAISDQVRQQVVCFAYLNLLWKLVNSHGVCRSVYSDRHTIFFSPKSEKLSIEEELAGKRVPLTQFGRALEELSIGHIPARSPQAKGRVERLWNTLQHRLVVELRLAGISTLEEANSFLEGFIRRFNEEFSVQPSSPEPAYAPAPEVSRLRTIICLKEQRKASNGSTISYQSQTYQIVDAKGAVVPLIPKKAVFILSHLDGSMEALYQDTIYQLKPCQAPTRVQREMPASNLPRRPTPPAPDHPWRRPFKPLRKSNVQPPHTA